MFPLSCARVSAHTDFRDCTHIKNLLHSAHRHIVVDHKITIIRQTINFSSPKSAPIQAEDLYFGLHVILDTKTAPFLGEDLFFGPHLISVTKNASIVGEFLEKGRTRQNFCTQRPQKLEGTLLGNNFFIVSLTVSLKKDKRQY